MHRSLLRWAALSLVTLAGASAPAMPPAPSVLCEVWPEAAPCADGLPDCTTCHTAPPARNSFGQAIEAVLAPDVARPLDQATFAEALPAALSGVADEDADGDGASNIEEILAGTSPGDANETPMAGGDCDGPNINPDWNVCGYDPAYAFRKVYLDVCGRSPAYGELQDFRAATLDEQMAWIDDALGACLDTPFWLGRDGVLWRLAHAKIRPLEAVKSGAGRGPVPLADYDHDYALFAYASSGDRDARLLLTADFHVRLSGSTRYEPAEFLDESLGEDRRVGMISTRWFFVINTMFTPVPRTTAAQAYRAYLGLDIARSEGLVPPDDAPLVDYDDKGVLEPTCAACHTTLDPLSYPFSRYRGISGGATGIYDAQRMTRYPPSEGARIREVPEQGYLFGEPVADLVEWADVAANSDAFARAMVGDYWRLMIGHEPTPAEQAEFDALWRAFRTTHEYRIERMLHALVRTEAYGAP